MRRIKSWARSKILPALEIHLSVEPIPNHITLGGRTSSKPGEHERNPSALAWHGCSRSAHKLNSPAITKFARNESLPVAGAEILRNESIQLRPVRRLGLFRKCH